MVAEKCERLTAMLDRWEAEDADDEPEWDANDLRNVRLILATRVLD